ncbi:MAG: nucleotidyl transferase AbiEii/AbiGii toxin family protein [Candidatus Sericytochromatia bacterium]
MKQRGPNPAASVRQRLLNMSKEQGINLDELMTRFAISRLLYRLAASGFQGDFVLKGATLFTIWQDAPHRPTRDVDLLGQGAPSIERLIEIFRTVVTTEPAEADGLAFDPDSVAGSRIREDAEHEGVRVTLTATLASARIRLQIDIGFGDVVLPGPEPVEVPTFFGFPPAQLLAYPREAVIAEKFQAMVILGEANTRMKDFYDLWTLAKGHQFDGPRLIEAIAGTFNRRRTSLPTTVPLALTPSFAENPLKLTQWRGFLNRAGITPAQPALADLAPLLAAFLMPPVLAAGSGEPFHQTWHPGGPWQPRP